MKPHHLTAIFGGRLCDKHENTRPWKPGRRLCKKCRWIRNYARTTPLKDLAPAKLGIMWL